MLPLVLYVLCIKLKSGVPPSSKKPILTGPDPSMIPVSAYNVSDFLNALRPGDCVLRAGVLGITLGP